MRSNRNHSSLVRMLVLGLALIAFGCAGGSAPDSETAAAPDAAHGTDAASATDPVQKAAGIANAIEAAPDRANEILEAHGMTAEQFEALLYEIAQDPAKSEAYAAARQAG